MNINEFAGKKVAIVGYGREGHSVEEWLKKVPGHVGIEIRDKTQGSGYLRGLENFDLVVKSAGVPANLINVPYTTPTNIFFDNFTGRTIGVTGTKGKSTTASLIYHVLKSNGIDSFLAGNIGIPAIDFLGTADANGKTAVLELSSFQLEDCYRSPHIAVCVSLFPEHIDRYPTIEKYYEAKSNIWRHQQPKDFLVFNPEFQLMSLWADTATAKAIPYGRYPEGFGPILLIGQHNRWNAGAALETGRIMGIADEKIAASIRTFRPLEHRLEFVGKYRNVKFYDDAISTTPESAIAALDSLENVSVLFLGGQERGYDFSKLADAIAKKGISKFVFFPDNGRTIRKVLQGKIDDMEYIETPSMEEAVKFAFGKANPGSICLLSCASPSYSVWKNFEEKGDLFKKFVRKYGAE